MRQFWVVFGLKILGLGYTFTWNFLGVGFTVILKILVMGAECKYNRIILRVGRDQFQVNRYQVFFVFKNVLRSELRSDGHLGQKFSFPALDPLSL